MNIFTNNDYKKIQAWLKANAIKDSDLENADVLGGEDIFTLVQDGQNKKVSLNAVKEFSIKDLQEDVKKNYSKKSNTIRHLSLSPSADENGMSLLLEGEYDDSINGSHLFGPHNIILPYATENKAGVMSPEDKKAIVENKNNIEKLSLDVSALFTYEGTMNLPFTDFVNFCKINLYAGNAPVKYIPDETNADHFILERSIITYYGSGITAKRECASVYRTGSNTVKTSDIRTKNYELP